MRQVREMEGQYRLPALELVEEVFTQYDSPEEGQMVRRLVEEIRAGRYDIPRLELVMVDEEDGVIGYAMFSRFPIEGKYEEELLLLSPVAVKTALQRQHISKDLLEYGFARAEELGFRAVLVEGDPQKLCGPELSAQLSLRDRGGAKRPAAPARMPDGEGAGGRGAGGHGGICGFFLL